MSIISQYNWEKHFLNKQNFKPTWLDQPKNNNNNNFKS